MSKTRSNIGALLKQGDLWLILGIFGTVLLLIFPVPPLVLDLLLTISIALSLLILLVILYVEEPADFSGFPTLLLFITLFRLALNVATTRLILLDGYAGHIIEAFGNFVVRGNYIVGLVVFFILVLINFIVITKGAGRIAEVAARFTLDAMPGKQMAIDAELSAGVITELEARTRRKKVEQEADFYGAMDGASKFVRGDAIAAILITLINVIGGFAIGVLQKGYTVPESLQRFTLLSIGDGLVSQVPALITSMAAGLLVTRAAAKNNLGTELRNQLLLYPRALSILSGMLLVMALIPGLPMFPFLVLSVCTWLVARGMRKSKVAAAQELNVSAKQAEAVQKKEPEKLESLLQVDPFQIELGYGLVNLADQKKGGDLLDRVTGVRRNFTQEMGVIVPPIRLRDNLQMKPNEYRFLIKGAPVAQGSIMAGYWLAMNASNSKVVLKGIPTTEPVFQLPATWITDAERKNAELAGYTVVDAASVLVTHLSETVKRHCHEIFSRQDVQSLLDNLKQTHATVVNELIPAQLTVGQVQRILQNLLAEGISIRNLSSILEKIGDYAHITKNPDELAEYARRALGAQIVRPFQSENGAVRAITLDPRLEQQIAQGMRQTPNELNLVLEPNLARHIIGKLSQYVQQMVASGQQPLVLCAPQIRLGFKRFFDSAFAELSVLSYAEVPSRVEVQSAGTVELPATA
ncbi:MAG: flagellar biosynthesis protein FlhA [Limisphaerales bacterium]